MAAITRSLYTAFSEFQPLLILILSLGSYSAVFGHTLTARCELSETNGECNSVLRAHRVISAAVQAGGSTGSKRGMRP